MFKLIYMSYPIASQATELLIKDQQVELGKAIAEDRPWEDISKMTSEHNAQLL